jgi:murein endopeptidase
MLEGPGRIIYAARWKTWGTAATVAHLDFVLRQWARSFPSAPPVLVGNLSARKGGHLPPHSSHQSGRDVDVSYIAKWDGKSEVSWQKMNAQNLDAALTWELLRLFVSTGAVELIFIDYDLQRLLYDHAKARRLFSPEQLALWLQYPDGPTTRGRIIQHVPGHADHIHVRFACRSTEPRCVPSPSAPDQEYLSASDITSSPPPPLPTTDPASPAAPPTSPSAPSTSPSSSTTTTTVMAAPPPLPRDPFLALDEDDRLFSP